VFTITPPAMDVLSQTRIQKGAPEGYGVRFYTTSEQGSDAARLAFAFVDAPEADDTTIADTAMDAWVAPDVERLIGDVVVDVRQQGDQMGLVVRRSSQA